MNDVANLQDKLTFRLHLVEKPWFYYNGKIYSSSPFRETDSDVDRNIVKLYLEEVAGDTLSSIAHALNRANADGQDIFVLVDSKGKIWKEMKGKEIVIKCLVR